MITWPRFAQALVISALLAAASAASAATQGTLFDADWKFNNGDAANAQIVTVNDAAWSSVHLPHDWMIAGPIAAKNPTGAEGAFFPSGVGWYRKTFTPPADWSGKHVAITFDGVYMLSDVWINGEKLGNHPYGYTPFTYDLTAHLKPGIANVIAVRVDNSKTMNSRFYSGSGIYRHVWLDVQDPLHIPRNGVYVTSQIQGSAPDFNSIATVQTTLANDSDSNRSCKLETQLLNPEGKGVKADIKAGAGGDGGDGALVESNSQTVEIPAHSTKTVEMKIRVPVARLWSTDTPNLYRAVSSRYDSVRLYLNDKLIGEKPTTRAQQFKATFSVPYAAGTLKTVGITAGKEAQSIILKTAGPIAGLRLVPDRAAISADGEDLSFITVESVDADGNFQPNGDQSVSFDVTGAGTLAAVASGDLSGTEGYQDQNRRLFHGRAQIIVRAGVAAGEIQVQAKAPGLRDASANVKTLTPSATP